MKLLSILLGVCFIFSVSQKTFACDCDKNHAGKAGPAEGTLVADAKDATKDAAKDAKDATKAEGKGCACEKEGKPCKCKDCGCSKKDGKKAHKHGKDCGCDDKHEA